MNANDDNRYLVNRRRTKGRLFCLRFILPITVSVVIGILLSVNASEAQAFVEPNTLGGSGCSCHDVHGDPSIFSSAGGDCASCHAASDSSGFTSAEPSGPHGGYTTTTRKCAVCHSVHDASADGVVLLPAATVVDTCFTCHDGTQGWGVYGTIEARGGTVGGGHSYGSSTSVPGGDASTGGAATRVFSGPGDTLICTDCHSPHGSYLVQSFVGERNRVRTTAFDTTPESSRLLRTEPTGAASPVTSYGSDWCLGCHAGRDSGGVVHNHPVESIGTVAEPYTYENVAVLDSDDETSDTVIGQMGGVTGAQEHGGFYTVSGRNRGFLMPYPRTTGIGGQDGHYPMCQQCHEDSRDAGTLVGDGSTADAAGFSVPYGDSVGWSGSAWVTTTADNPRFQNFPHETQNAYMLVETADNLCLNCHPAAQLP